MQRTAVLTLLGLCLLPAAEPVVLDGVPFDAAVQVLAPLGAPLGDASISTTTRGHAVIRLAIPSNSATASICQAVAVAADAWWFDLPRARDTDDAGASHPILTALPCRPHPDGMMTVIPSHVSGTRRHQLLIESLMEPWRGSGAIVNEGDDRWIAMLDAEGAVALRRILTLLERPLPTVPPLPPQPGAAVADTRLPMPLPAGPWGPWMRELAVASSRPVAVAPTVTGPAPAVPDGVPLPAALARQGMTAALVAGTWTIGGSEDRLLPERRRALALIPIPQWPVDEGGVAALEACAAAVIHPYPGWMARWLPEERQLLVAADVATIHRVLDRIEQREQRESPLEP